MSALPGAQHPGWETDVLLPGGEVEELFLLLTRREATALERLAGLKGLTLAQLLRRFIRQGLADAAEDHGPERWP